LLAVGNYGGAVSSCRSAPRTICERVTSRLSAHERENAMTSILERAAKLGLRFDVLGLRDFVLIDEATGESHDFQTTDALKVFLSAKEHEAQQRRHIICDR
jgi:hypothetical protein